MANARPGSMLAGSFLLVLLFLPVGALAADATPTDGMSEELVRRFRLADRDRDGALSPAEAKQANWFGEQVNRFESLDADRSGTVTLVEIGAAITSRVQEWLGADTDGDGRISAAEAQAQSGTLADAFRTGDDGDGSLTREELESLSQRSYFEHSELPSVAPNIFEKRF